MILSGLLCNLVVMHPQHYHKTLLLLKVHQSQQQFCSWVFEILRCPRLAESYLETAKSIKIDAVLQTLRFFLMYNFGLPSNRKAEHCQRVLGQLLAILR